jgi:hypothetical protein
MLGYWTVVALAVWTMLLMTAVGVLFPAGGALMLQLIAGYEVRTVCSCSTLFS